MNLFKKLCKQNQEWKYTAIRDRLELCIQRHVRDRRAARARAVADHAAAVAAQLAVGPVPEEDVPIGLCDLPGFDPPGTRRRRARSIKTFQQWIEHEPLERWSLLHDTHGARYGVMTTNLAETYNFVLRGNRALPLTAIVEGIFYGTVKYFRERRERAEKHMMDNPTSPYCEKVKIGNEVWPTCECTCNKPKLLHLPCSHVLAACRQLRLNAISFVSPYYMKEAVINTWTGEMMGFRSMGNFNTVTPGERVYIPAPELLRDGVGRRQCRHIRNDMDESEA